MSEPLITFAIPFYSTPEYLRKAIDSVRAQTRSDWLLLVNDDKSPHAGIRELCESYNDPRIRYACNEQNLKQAGNWNRCLEQVTTPYVTLLHADDELLPNYAEAMLSNMEKFPEASGLFCQCKIIDGVGKEIFSFVDFYKVQFLLPSKTEAFELKGEAGLETLLHGNIIMCPTVCYRRSQLKGLKFSADWKCAPDLDYFTRLILAGGSLVGIPDLAFAYRRHEESGTAVTQRNRTMFDEEIRLFEKLRADAEGKGWKKAAALAKDKMIVKKRIVFNALQDLLALRVGSSVEKLRMAISA